MKRIFVMLFLLCTWASAPTAQPTRYVYVSPVDGSGTDADPYHSRCLGMSGSGTIDLRPWGIDRFLCSSNTLPIDMTGVAQLGSSVKEKMTGPRKAALVALAKKGVVADTVDEAIVELLSSGLRAGRDGKIKIWLGEPIPLHQQTAWVPFRDHGYVADVWNALQPAVAWATTIATETFTASDGDLAGCDARGCTHLWAEFNGTGLAIVSNTAKHTGATTNEARLEADLATDDFDVQVTMTAFVGSSESRCGVIGRKDTTTTRTFYSVHATNSTAAEWRLIKRVAGTSTVLATDPGDPVAGDTMLLRMDGSSISAQVNGGALQLGPVTDTSITGNVRGGIMAIGAGAGDSCTLDNVNESDYAPSSGGILRRRVS